MKYVFDRPDKVMVGVRGEVGNRLFLLQARQGRRLVIVKCEKQQLSALAQWLAAVLTDDEGIGELPPDLALEPEYEADFVAGDIAVALDEETTRIDVNVGSVDEADELELTLTREWAGALAIAVIRLVAAGRPLCPLCAGPLDARGHDCPRTNGHRPPIR